MELNDWKTWLGFVVVLFIFIFILIGFLAGYFYGDKSAIEDPFTYGIKEINEANDDKFACTCFSESGNIDPFSFDENGIINDFFGLDFSRH